MVSHHRTIGTEKGTLDKLGIIGTQPAFRAWAVEYEGALTTASLLWHAGILAETGTVGGGGDGW